MKKIITVILVVLVFSCKKTQEEGKPITITNNEVKEMISFLASDELLGRKTGTLGIDSAAKYIENLFKSYGIKPYFETYRDNFKVDSLNAFNVVGYIEGKDKNLKNEYVIIGAHYDHIGNGKNVENDSIANGANDNASGTATVIALAKYFAARKNNKRSILFTLFSAEELGLLGSKHLAQKLKEKDIDLYTMINFEMVGVPFKDKDYVALITGYEMSNMPSKINSYAKHNFVGFSEVSKKYSLFKRSDNYPFFQEFNLPCHTISTCDLTNFDHYHKVGDEAQLMDYNHITHFTNKAASILETLINTPTKEIALKNE